MTDLELATNGERIIWRGKPKFSCFVLETIFNPMLFVALIWGGIDLSFMTMAFSAPGAVDDGFGMFMILFFALHLMPVWIYLGGVISSVVKYKNTEYIVTERGVYISGGFFSLSIEMKPFTDLSHVTIHKGMFDQILGVGDVVMVCNHSNSNSHSHSGGSFSICDIAEYQDVFRIIKEMQTDIYADTMYPNAMRPDNNPGYRTGYDKF